MIQCTFFTDLSAEDIKPDTLTAVVWSHHYDPHDNEESIEARDGDYLLKMFLLYEDCLKGDSHERLPTQMGFYGYFYTFMPRFDLNKEIVMDLEWVTFHDSLTTTEGFKRFLHPYVAYKEKLIVFDLGLFAELNERTNTWMHSLVDVSYYTEEGRTTHMLELSPKLTEVTSKKSYTTGKEVCRIDRETGALRIVDLARGDDLMHGVRAKILETLTDSILPKHISETNMKGDGEAWVPNLAHMLKFGLYPASMKIDWQGLPEHTTESECGGNVDQVKSRAYYVYAADRAFLMDPSRKRLTTDRFEKEAHELDTLAQNFNLDKYYYSVINYGEFVMNKILFLNEFYIF